MTTAHRLSAVALMLVVSVALAACGSAAATESPAAATESPAAATDSPAAATDSPAAESPSISAPSPTSAASVQNAVTISGFAFSPASITVPVGTKVTWTNQDSATHTITSDDGKTFSSGNVANGSTFSFTFTIAGTFAYHCAIHPSMKGTVIVTP